MSLAVFTDSTTAQDSPALSCRFNSGSSTKTTSVSSCWAWSVMPTVAVSPLTRTHSCDFAYFKSEGTFDMARLRQGGMFWSIRFSIKRFGNDGGGAAFAANFNFNGCTRLRVLGFHVPHAHAHGERRALSAAGHFAHFCSA